MAITFEEDKNRVNWIGILTAVIIIGFIGIAVFYLFFSQPAVVEKFIFPNLKTISEFKSVKFNFEDAFSNPAFKNLKSIVDFAFPPDNLVGKSNPFVQ